MSYIDAENGADMCTNCGAVVGSRSLHDDWHARLVESITIAIRSFFGQLRGEKV